MTIGPLAFLSPWLLGALVALPLIYWLLRAVPPRPSQIEFPPTRILVGLENEEKTVEKTPWWLTLIRLLAAALVIFALADPILNPSREAAIKREGPLVVLVDNGWAAASRWTERARMIERLIGEAEGAGRAVMIVGTAPAAKAVSAKLESPADARAAASALAPQPYAPDRAGAVASLEAALAAAGVKQPSIVWLHDGIDHKKDVADIAAKFQALAGGASLAVIDETRGQEAIGVTARLAERGKLEALVLSPAGRARQGAVYAFSARGERLGEASYKLSEGATSAVAAFDLPLELRNQVARIELSSERSAGAVSLIDAATQWHRVGLISGESREQAQPLLAPLYYIQKALTPYAELAVSNDSNLAVALNSVLNQNVSSIMLADIGTLTGEAAKQVEGFLERGGVLIRFAGPRLEKAGDDLLPVQLRSGGRSLGGALSWSTPQPLAAFDEESPFAGLTIPADVKINRQVLADPAELTPEVQIWARLQDGTPLVTATKRGEGRLVLFHVTANSDWSNLPISGLFVEMLRRTLGNGAHRSEFNFGRRSDGERAIEPDRRQRACAAEDPRWIGRAETAAADCRANQSEQSCVSRAVVGASAGLLWSNGRAARAECFEPEKRTRAVSEPAGGRDAPHLRQRRQHAAEADAVGAGARAAFCGHCRRTCAASRRTGCRLWTAPPGGARRRRDLAGDVRGYCFCARQSVGPEPTVGSALGRAKARPCRDGRRRRRHRGDEEGHVRLRRERRSRDGRDEPRRSPRPLPRAGDAHRGRGGRAGRRRHRQRRDRLLPSPLLART